MYDFVVVLSYMIATTLLIFPLQFTVDFFISLYHGGYKQYQRLDVLFALRFIGHKTILISINLPLS